MILQPHQQRVVDEKVQLDEKLHNLANFIGGKIYAALPVAEQKRMYAQMGAMSVYSAILEMRIDNFSQS